ncbi:mechanosensitive ion channel [Haloferax sp. MBLA0076]|uniref:Mechanosensitive ion channel n=1 Tax=Haloferax litoreum TaxID=2666140 RepID=A0A6A8GDT3_9EURY|nr:MULTISPECIES: mechanosensitive ion channel domain-containing protein [Haloferax]KAB1192568.1 mechanosensitive ion channel [Haloferax sp. CBA1148]MRX21039.1 mechanosensitive ion channel [Haloferax litoreum]
MLPFRPVVVAVLAQIDPGQFGVYEDAAGAAAGFVVGALVVYLFGRLALVPGVTRVVSSRNENNPTLETATRTYTHAFVVLAAGLAGLVGAGYGSLLTDTALIIAALTLVLGVAGQEVIGALISGLFLVADPDFNVGDWISWPNGEGVVEAVDFRVTRVRTLNNETVTVPNTELTTNVLVRPYGRERYRVTERVDVAYSDDVELALRELVEVTRGDDRVLEDPEPTSRIVEFAGSSVGLKAEFWVESPMDVNLIDLRSQFRRRVKLRFDEVGLTLGPPSGREVSGSLNVDLADGRGSTPDLVGE